MARVARWFAALVVGLSWAGHAQADDQCGEALRPYATATIDRIVLGAESLAKRIEAGDLEGAKQAWVEARVGWKRGEPFLLPYFPELTAAIGGSLDAEAGFRAIEPMLFLYQDTQSAHALAHRLVGDAAALQWRIETASLAAPGLIEGLVAATKKLGRAKAEGGDSLDTQRSLADLQDRLRGIETTYALSFGPLTRQRHPALHARIMGHLITLGSALRVPSINELEAITVATLTEDLGMDFEEIALLVELEGVEVND